MHKISFLYILITVLCLIPLAQSNPPTTTNTTSVANFCAVGNGSADDTNFIQSAINSSFTRVEFPAGGTYPIEILYIPTGKELAVEKGAEIFGSKELKGTNSACWNVSLAAGGGGVVISGGGRISGTTLISVKKGDDKDVMFRWAQEGRIFENNEMSIGPNNFCIICDHGYSCDPLKPGHW